MFSCTGALMLNDCKPVTRTSLCYFFRRKNFLFIVRLIVSSLSSRRINFQVILTEFFFSAHTYLIYLVFCCLVIYFNSLRFYTEIIYEYLRFSSRTRMGKIFQIILFIIFVYNYGRCTIIVQKLIFRLYFFRTI